VVVTSTQVVIVYICYVNILDIEMGILDLDNLHGSLLDNSFI